MLSGLKNHLFFICFVTYSFISNAQGLEKMYYEDGSLKAEGQLENGIKNGTWKFYYPSGALSSIENYADDQLDGEIEYFDEHGNKIAHEQWNGGVQVDSSFYYYANGSMEKKGIFMDGLYEGLWRFYFESGALKRTGQYHQGLPHGEWKFFNEDKFLIQYGFFMNGVEDGEWKFYTKDGELEFYGNYKGGAKSGKWYRVTKKGKSKSFKY